MLMNLSQSPYDMTEMEISSGDDQRLDVKVTLRRVNIDLKLTRTGLGWFLEILVTFRYLFIIYFNLFIYLFIDRRCYTVLLLYQIHYVPV